MRTANLAAALVLFLFFESSLSAQYQLSNKHTKVSLVNSSPQKNLDPEEKCGFAYIMNKAKEKGFDENEFERVLEALIEKRKLTGAKTTTIYTLPIIFHVVHRGEAAGTLPNVSQAQINAQITQLNNDFSNLAGSSYGVAADMGVRFCAALVDPTGKILAEPGIDRLNSITKGWDNIAGKTTNQIIAYFDATIKPQSIWDPSIYVNIWTANMTSGLLGYATFPSLSTLSGLDNTETNQTAGVVLIAGGVGSVASPGTIANYSQGKTATHELGHFFGLRHIWGDGTCATDYCADTPPQNTSTSGCPASPAPNNCTPAANKMFENYMDYSYDACMNTYTADQSTRAQTVMVNSPRRLELATSLACMSRPGNSVQFSQKTLATTETGTTGTCPRVKTITATVTVATQSTGNATLTFTTGGSSTNGADYTVSPASVSFTNGDNSDKTVTITIIDDGAAESIETLVLGYTISGTGVIAGPEKQTFTVTITDDDFIRTINQNATQITILSENFNASTSFPAGWTTQNGSNAWVVSGNAGGGIITNAAHITENTTTKPNTYNENVASQSYMVSPLINATGLYDIEVIFDWRCKGENFMGTAWDAGYIGYILPSAPNSVNLLNQVFNGQSGQANVTTTSPIALPSTLNNSQFYLVFYWENDDNSGNDPGFTVDNIQVTGKPTKVESTAATSVIAPHYSGQTIQYISADNEIISSISGPSQDLGCITSTVQNAGTGKTIINTASGSYFRTDKVVTMVPATANSTATYQGTLYFTTAELSPAWSPIEIPNLKILKVKDGVSLAGVISPTDAVIVTPTFNDNSASGYYSYTGSFTGFSQFMLVSPTFALPVELTVFEAIAEQKSIVLSWITSSELNNKGFVIERSTDAVAYEKIGWIDGKGTSSDESSYRFNDNYVQPNLVYYYRLRQTDFDGREKLSVVRQAKISGTGFDLIVSPNPAGSEVKVFVKGTLEPADISLMNSIGQQVAFWKKQNIATPSSLSISHLPRGYYRVLVHLKEGVLSSQLIIE